MGIYCTCEEHSLYYEAELLIRQPKLYNTCMHPYCNSSYFVHFKLLLWPNDNYVVVIIIEKNQSMMQTKIRKMPLKWSQAFTYWLVPSWILIPKIAFLRRNIVSKGKDTSKLAVCHLSYNQTKQKYCESVQSSDWESCNKQACAKQLIYIIAGYISTLHTSLMYSQY